MGCSLLSFYSSRFVRVIRACMSHGPLHTWLEHLGRCAADAGDDRWGCVHWIWVDRWWTSPLQRGGWPKLRPHRLWCCITSKRLWTMWYDIFCWMFFWNCDYEPMILMGCPGHPILPIGWYSQFHIRCDTIICGSKFRPAPTLQRRSPPSVHSYPMHTPSSVITGVGCASAQVLQSCVRRRLHTVVLVTFAWSCAWTWSDWEHKNKRALLVMGCSHPHAGGAHPIGGERRSFYERVALPREHTFWTKNDDSCET